MYGNIKFNDYCSDHIQYCKKCGSLPNPWGWIDKTRGDLHCGKCYSDLYLKIGITKCGTLHKKMSFEDIYERYKILSADSARSRSKITQRKDIMLRIKDSSKRGGYQIRYQFTTPEGHTEVEEDVKWLRNLEYRVTELDRKNKGVLINEYIVDWWPKNIKVIIEDC